MNLKEISDLTHIIVYLKSVINSAGISRFADKNTIPILNKQLGELEKKFVQEVLKLDLNQDINVYDELKKAKNELEKNSLSKKSVDTVGIISSSKSIDLNQKNIPEIIKKQLEKSSDTKQELDTSKVKQKKIKSDKNSLELKEVKEKNKSSSEDFTVKKSNDIITEDGLSLSQMLAAEKKKIAARKK